MLARPPLKTLLLPGATILTGGLLFLAIAGLWQERGDLGREAMENGQQIAISLKDGSMEGLPLMRAETESDSTANPASESMPGEEGQQPPINSALPGDFSNGGEPVEGATPAESSIDENASNAEGATPPDTRLENMPLAAAPNETLVEKLPSGETLPIISSQGIRPWRYYAKPFDGGAKPLIAVIVSGLGLGRFTTEAAIALPPDFTLSLSPYAREASLWADTARKEKHEVLVDLPVQTTQYPAVDPGPYSMMKDLTADVNRDRLHWVMSRFSGYTGLLAPSDMVRDPMIQPVRTEIGARGVLLLNHTGDAPDHTTKTPALPDVPVTVVIDGSLTKESIDSQLAALEKQATEKGYAIGTAKAYPITLEQLKLWQASLDAKGIRLAPVSAVAKKQYD